MNTEQKRIAFCITCKGRAHHIRRTLPQNLIDNADYANAIFVIVNYNSPDTLMEELKTNHSAEIESGRIVVYTVKDVTTFKMAHAKNIAHRLGIREGADILVNLDADNMTGPGFAHYINKQFKADPNIFMWARMIPGILPRGISGRIVVTKDVFIQMGGYDEQFETWSRDDKDFNERLIRTGYTPHEIPQRFLCGIRHDDKLRFKEYPHVRPDKDHYDCPIPPPCTNTVVNFGFFGICIVTRNFEFDIEIVLGPIPTRIFGIGMHKTGTTSLFEAFKILGFHSFHWKSPRLAKMIWKEMNECGNSLTLERYYALCDLPITLLYKKLDETYPNSKFILTIREEHQWLKSVEKHWSYETNKFRETWDNDWFTHRIHKQVYGQINFDAEVMLARYRKHNKEVIEYFKDRPHDLLILKVDREIDWHDLCRFLGKDIPVAAYPKANTTVDPEPDLIENNGSFFTRINEIVRCVFDRILGK